jgi:hypothetical protein
VRARDPRLWLGLASLAVVLSLFALDFEETSPGPLSPSHAAVELLRGQEGCDECHAGLGTSMAGSCLQCHAEIERQLEARSGLHGGFIAQQGDVRACERCHVEHHGGELPLAGAEAFALAGLGAPEAFDHGPLEFALTGRHVELGCEQCHAYAHAPQLEEGQLRYLGLEQGCTACHSDPHGGRFELGCASCHGQQRPFGELASFTHGSAFPLTGAHGRAACAECHPKGSDREVEDLAGRDPAPPPRACADCHASPHRAGFAEAAGRALDAAAGASCSACHDAEQGPFTAASRARARELHGASGFALDAPHGEVACEACHAADPEAPRALALRQGIEPLPDTASAAFAARHPGRTADDCGACHADPHGGQFEVEPYTRQGCIACHDLTGFQPPAFGREEHARCAFPLDGRHIDVDCSACHAERIGTGEDAPRRFRGTPLACSACHVDAHAIVQAGAFASTLAKREELGGCAACHATSGFADVDVEAFDHARWTGFELSGAHARASCETCHPRVDQPGPGQRSFGLASARFGAPLEGCASCHADPHRGAFARGDESAGCEACHATDSFRIQGSARPFDHGAWTGFVLDGAHARAACASCHGAPPAVAKGPVPSARSFGFAREIPSPAACAECHADPHGGRFGDSEAASATCGTCHSTESFAAIDREGFDHARWTGFALEGAHALSACEACHAPAERADPDRRRLGAVLGAQCSDCHADPHAGQFARGGRTDCSACHLAAHAFQELDFDHQTDSRFALSGPHARLECAACHRPWPLSSGELVVRYKPLGVECIQCHDPNRRRAGEGAPR